MNKMFIISIWRKMDWQYSNGKSFFLPPAACRLLPPAHSCLLLLVNVRLPRRPCLPALMNPEPLVRVKTDHALNRRCEASGVNLDVLAVIAGTNQLDRRVAVKKVALPFLVPDGAGWNHYRISLQRECGNAGSRAGELSEEGNKNSFARLRVEIREDAERATFAQHSQRLSGCTLFIDRSIAKPRPDALDHFFDARIVERANQETDRILKRRPAEAVQFPATQVACQENHSALILLSLSQVGQTNFVILDKPAQFLRRRAR